MNSYSLTYKLKKTTRKAVFYDYLLDVQVI